MKVKRRKKRLTDLKLKRHTPKNGRQILWDVGGLGVLIGKRTKSWLFRYSFDGARKLITLGQYPAMSLEEAQAAAAEARLKVKKGVDPLAEKQAKKQARKEAPTVEQFIEEFWEIELSKKKTGKERKRLLTFDVVPEWGRRKVADITRRDIVLLIDKVRERAPVTANRLLGVMTRFFNFACERGILIDSPCARIRKAPETGRDRVLTDKEIKKLWKGLDLKNKEVNIYIPVKLALKLVLLTGQRPGEVAGALWEEIDGNIWTIPAERMKGGIENRVPLTGMALEILKEARRYSGDSPFVFQSPRKRNAPITAASLPHAVIRHWEDMKFKEAFRPHDLRRTLRTRLAELGVEDVIAERVLGHKLQGVMAVYNRHSYDKEKRQALEQWESKLRLIVGLDTQRAAKVIPLRRK